jgi:hypothetical protein
MYLNFVYFQTIAREEFVNAHDVEVSLIWYAL